MKIFLTSWPFWALLSAGFAALTAIFAKIGVENVNSDFATFIRTIVILLAAGAMVYITGNWQEPSTVSTRQLAISCTFRFCHGRILDLLLPGAEAW